MEKTKIVFFFPNLSDKIPANRPPIIVPTFIAEAIHDSSKVVIGRGRGFTEVSVLASFGSIGEVQDQPAVAEIVIRLTVKKYNSLFCQTIELESVKPTCKH